MQAPSTANAGTLPAADDPALASARIIFIGGGNMGGAIVAGLVGSGHRPDQITVVDPDEARLSALSATYRVKTAPAADAAVAAADLVVLAVKPQQAAAVLGPLAEALAARAPTLLSVAAGLSVSALARCSGLSGGILRAMPNIPALVGAGVSGLFTTDATPSGRALGEYVLRAVGDVVWLDEESQFDALTALSGSGPAYFYALAEAMADAGVALGLSQELSDTLARKTLQGAGALLASQNEGPAELRVRVTSKGGTTAAALEVLTGAAGLGPLVHTAMQAAASRSLALGALFEEE